MAVATIPHALTTAMLPVVAVTAQLQLDVLKQAQAHQGIGRVQRGALPAAAVSAGIGKPLLPGKRAGAQRLGRERDPRAIERRRIVGLRESTLAEQTQCEQHCGGCTETACK